MGKGILILVLLATLVQINVSAPSPSNEHRHGGSVTEYKRSPVTKHRERRSRLHAGKETAEKTALCGLEATNNTPGHWEWIADVPSNNPFMIPAPTVAPATLPTMQPAVYPFYPMPMWAPSASIPTFLPTPVQLTSMKELHENAPGGQHHTKHKTKHHKKLHANNKDVEPKNSKHSTSTTQRKRLEGEPGDKTHGRSRNDGNVHPDRSHRKTIAEGKTDKNRISDSGRDHRESDVDSKRSQHSPKADHRQATDSKAHHDKPPDGKTRHDNHLASTRDDESVNRKLRPPSQVDSEKWSEDARTGLVSAQSSSVKKSENMEKPN